MKVFFVVMLSVTALFLWQRSQSGDSATVANSQAASSAPAPSTPRPVYEHDWAKHSLDRTHEVMDQVHQSRTQGEQP